MSNSGDKFREYLAARGKGLTREREVISEEVFSSSGQFDIDQLLRRLSNRTDGRRVSRATIYRTLMHMVDAGLLQRTTTHNDHRDAFEQA